jgi:hypothetical protein
VCWVALSTHSENFPVFQIFVRLVRRRPGHQTSFGRIQGADRRAAADTLKPADASDFFCRAYISNTSNVAGLALFFWAGRAWLIPAG